MSGDSVRSSSSMEISLSDTKNINMEHATEPTEECSLPGVSDEPKMQPRVGNQYQAIIPDLIEARKCSQLNAGKVNKVVNGQSLVLPIPLMWAPNKARDAERLSGQVDPFAEENKVVLIRETEGLLTEQAESTADKQPKASEIKLEDDMKKLDATLGDGAEWRVDRQVKSQYPLPCTPDEPWSDFEREVFVLALYIFGKDLCLVKIFVETKKTEDVVSFYYGPFYKCKEYQRWAKCLRSTSRKSIHGKRIFTGGRLQELVSRLGCHLSEETLKKVVEMPKTFKEDRISFEEYVFNLKELIGIKVLLEVVAIGKGKQDLTGISTLSRKLNRNLSVCQETQHDNGVSSLSCKEITKQLMSSRLSKNKSNELFWEAVWPRLLAGGWHSEQPKGHGVSNSKHQLVFLFPGITKYKRSKHVKGEHYFDSVSDVLNKVASDPRLLVLEDEKEKDAGYGEKHLDEQDFGSLNGKNNGYGKSRNSKPRNCKMEFMIVDTSKHQGSKVRWLESLPVHSTDISTSSSACSETGSDSSSEKSDDGDEETCAKMYAKIANGIITQSSKTCEAGSINDKKKSSKKLLPWEKLKSGPSKYLSPLQRHQVSTPSRENASEVTEKKRDKHLILCLRNPYKLKESKQPPNSLHIENKSTLLSLPNFSPKLNEVNGDGVFKSSKRTENPLEQPLPYLAIDLNIPQVPENATANHVIHHPTHSPLIKRKDVCGSSGSSSPRETTQQTKQVSRSNADTQQPLKVPRQQQRQTQIQQEQQTDTGGRRQSTRNRPLTTKALEAFESSFFETDKKRKATTDDAVSRPPRRQRVNSKFNSNSDSCIGSSDMTSTRIEEESATENSGNAPSWLVPPAPQKNLQLQLL